MKPQKQLYWALLTSVFFNNTSHAGFDAELSLSEIEGLNGIVVQGENPHDIAGFSVSHAGDLNGDEIDDFVIGAYGVDEGIAQNAGRSYVVFGSASGLPSPLNLSTLDGNNGFTIHSSATNGGFGHSVSHAGDVNHDGLDDLIIGAPYSNVTTIFQTGAAYVIFGQDEGFDNVINVEDLNGDNGFAIFGNQQQSTLGFSVSSAGDINDDGIDDVIISAPKTDNNGVNDSGAAYVIFGDDSGFPHSLSISALNGLNGFEIRGFPFQFNGPELKVSSAGDVNHDNINDVVIGGPRVGIDGQEEAGVAVVVYGQSTRFPNPVQMSEIDGDNGVHIYGIAAFDQTGYSVSEAGDVNADGIDDLIIGARRTDFNVTNTGSAYVVYGQSSGLAHPLDLNDINGLNGFRIDGNLLGAELGTSVHSAGDINHDGINDLVVGAPDDLVPDTNAAGKSYVIYGSDQGIGHPINVAALDGNNGFAIAGSDDNGKSGQAVSQAGDVNNDGISDFIISAHLAGANGINAAGKTYVVYGREKPLFKGGFE